MSYAQLESSRPRAPQPDNITIVENTRQETAGESRRTPSDRGRLVLRRSWLSSRSLVMVIVCILADVRMADWSWMSSVRAWLPGFMFVVLPILQIAIGVAITYITVAGLINKTWITLADGALSIRHGPLPWVGNKTLAVADIELIYREKVDENRPFETSFLYKLSATLSDGRDVELLDMLSSADEARFLEQCLDEQIRIPDAPVAGEFKS